MYIASVHASRTQSWARSGLFMYSANLLVRFDSVETNGALYGWQTEFDAVGGQVFVIALASAMRNSADIAPIFASIFYFGSDFRSAEAKDRPFALFQQRRNETLSSRTHVPRAIRCW